MEYQPGESLVAKMIVCVGNSERGKAVAAKKGKDQFIRELISVI